MFEQCQVLCLQEFNYQEDKDIADAAARLAIQSRRGLGISIVAQCWKKDQKNEAGTAIMYNTKDLTLVEGGWEHPETQNPLPGKACYAVLDSVRQRVDTRQTPAKRIMVASAHLKSDRKGKPNNDIRDKQFASLTKELNQLRKRYKTDDGETPRLFIGLDCNDHYLLKRLKEAGKLEGDYSIPEGVFTSKKERNEMSPQVDKRLALQEKYIDYVLERMKKGRLACYQQRLSEHVRSRVSYLAPNGHRTTTAWSSTNP